MRALSVVWRSEESADFSSWEKLPEFSEIESHPLYSRRGRAFYSATFDRDIDTSFAIMDGAKPLVLVLCNIHESTLGLFGLPLVMFHNSESDSERRGEAVSTAFRALDGIANSRNIVNVFVKEEIKTSELSPIGANSVARGATPEIVQNGWCDLMLSEAAIRQHLRKSFQSLINRGGREMRLEYFNAANPDQQLFDDYKRFHAQVAGRVTRSDESWQAMSEIILGDGGELALGYFKDDVLVAGTMTLDAAEATYYASGVYDRTRFEKPLAHFPLFDAILRSKARNKKIFDLGPLPAKNVVSDKEYNIGYFKRGFATKINMTLVWRWKPSPNAANN